MIDDSGKITDCRTVEGYREFVYAVAQKIYLQETKGHSAVACWNDLSRKVQELYVRKALARRGIILKKEDVGHNQDQHHLSAGVK